MEQITNKPINYLVLTCFDFLDELSYDTEEEIKKAELTIDCLYKKKIDITTEGFPYLLKYYIPLIDGFIFIDKVLSYEIVDLLEPTIKTYIVDVKLIKIIEKDIDNIVYNIIKENIDMMRKNQLIEYHDPFKNYPDSINNMTKAIEFNKNQKVKIKNIIEKNYQ